MVLDILKYKSYNTVKPFVMRNGYKDGLDS
jgi:hypothetical protein